ncbi:MAG: hypothetical protein B2I17_01545 [Thermoplasmatales archaeon B_DKE]|nr:MAG: hypothetical protein B2I17_01545 [Thermoplasmatales archaeon B_DKE]
MVNSGFLKRIMVVGEKHVLGEMTVYMDMAQEATSLLHEMLDTNPKRMLEINEKIRVLERKGDNYGMQLTHEITSGAISSNLMDNLLNLTDKCDDILDKTHYLSREIKRMNIDYKRSNGTAIMASSYRTFMTMIEKSQEAIKSVSTMFSDTNMDSLKNERKKIEVLEEAVDELKDNLIDEIYRNADSLHFLVYDHLMSLVHKIDDMVDDCEDISDILMNIILSVSK